jgi:predicted Zn finger-like uncharacterized protein
MIVDCPTCHKRYRLPEDRLTGNRPLRCTGCGTVFRAQTSAAAPQDGPGAAAGPAAAPAATPARPVAPQGDGPQPHGATVPSPRMEKRAEQPLVLIADEDPAFRALAGRTLAALGCQVEMTADGRSAFHFAVHRRPALMLLSRDLKVLSGPAVCGGVKGSPHLGAIKVVLVGAGDDEECGADGVIERGLDADQVKIRLKQILQPESGHPGPQPAPVPAAGPAVEAPAPSPAPAAEAGEGTRPGSGSAAGKATDRSDPHREIHRLARIMVSELRLYNPERFAAAMKQGKFLDTFRMELTRGKDMIASRFPDLPDRVAVLGAALREAITAEARAASGGAEQTGS